MNNIEIENAVLVTILNGGPMRVSVILKRVSAQAGDAAPTWRQVASVVTKLNNLGWLEVTGDEMEGENMHPLFGLTSAGEYAAHSARVSQRNQAQAGTVKEADNVQE